MSHADTSKILGIYTNMSQDLSLSYLPSFFPSFFSQNSSFIFKTLPALFKAMENWSLEECFNN